MRKIFCKKKLNPVVYYSFFTKKNYIYYKCTKCKSLYIKNVNSFKKLDKKIFDFKIAQDTIFNLFFHISENLILKKYLSKDKEYLDISPGNYYFLLHFSKLCKTYTLKNSFTSKLLKSNSQKKINIIKKSSKKKFDIISLFGVLEHTSNPVKEILHYKKKLKKNGILILTFPNCKSFNLNLKKSYLAFAPLHKNILNKNILIKHSKMRVINNIKFILRSSGLVWMHSFFNYQKKSFSKSNYFFQTIYLIMLFFLTLISIFLSVFNRSEFIGIVLKKS